MPAVQAGLAVAAAFFAAALVLAATRALARARRRYVRLALLPYRTDRADPDAAVALFEALHAAVRQRWWRRLGHGPGVGRARGACGAAARRAGRPPCSPSPARPAFTERVQAAIRGGYPNTAFDAVPGDGRPAAGRAAG